jgi:hypothetical protein
MKSRREPWLTPAELGDSDGRAAAAVDVGLPVTLSGDALLARAWREARESVKPYEVEGYMAAFQSAYLAELDAQNEALLQSVTVGGDRYQRRDGKWERVA